MDAHEARTQARHMEVVGRFDVVDVKFDKLEDRVRSLELSRAGTAPLIKGFKGAALILFTALVGGYIGSLFGAS